MTLAAGLPNLKAKAVHITAALGGRAGKLESESGADMNLESRLTLAAGLANLKAKSVQTQIWNHSGPWRPGGQI